MRKKNGNKISDDHVLVVDTHLYTHRKYIEKFFYSEVIKTGDSSNEILLKNAIAQMYSDLCENIFILFLRNQPTKPKNGVKNKNDEKICCILQPEIH